MVLSPVSAEEAAEGALKGFGELGGRDGGREPRDGMLGTSSMVKTRSFERLDSFSPSTGSHNSSGGLLRTSLGPRCCAALAKFGFLISRWVSAGSS